MSGPRKLAFAREQTGRRELDAMQRGARETAERVNDCPLLAGVLRSVRLVAGTPKTVNHGLGTRATFILARSNYDGTGLHAVVNESAQAYQDALDIRNQLSVTAIADGLVDLWFYPIASESVPR